MTPALDQLTDRIREAAAHQTPMRIRGSGSKDFYGESLQGEVLDTCGHSGITSYEPSELVVTARGGTPLAELEAALAEKGQGLAFEPPRFSSADGAIGGTVGGMVAVGLSGPARASVGGVRDYVLGVQLVNGRAEHLTFGGQVMKNVAGYDVSRLMVGALGTLGLLTDVSLKVLPVAPAEATLVFEVDQARALNQLHTWGAQPLPLNASCWVHDTTAPNAPELLFVRLRGAAAAVESACAKMLLDLPGCRMDQAQAASDWTACRDMALPFFTTPTVPDDTAVLWRLSVPQTAPVLNLAWPQFVEWHGGQRWVWAPDNAHEQIRSVAASANGSATLFRATGTDNKRATRTFDALNPALIQIHRRLKSEFDPAGILNRGWLHPDF
ncbi:MAG: glycolate oxidase subunit GlcE [Rhodoferax sp.]|nr:glycolate oxidase subunit GlcE [Rhodoferax sp.]